MSPDAFIRLIELHMFAPAFPHGPRTFTDLSRALHSFSLSQYMASKAVYIFTLDDRERQRSFDFSGTISHADLFEKNTAAIQGLLPALKRGVRTTVDITAKDTGDVGT